MCLLPLKCIVCTPVFAAEVFVIGSSSHLTSDFDGRMSIVRPNALLVVQHEVVERWRLRKSGRPGKW